MGTYAYWIDDVRTPLTRTIVCLRTRLNGLEEWGTYSEAMKGIPIIKEKPGPVIIDLRLPWEDIEPIKLLDGPIIGMTLVGEFQAKLGKSWPIFILSANISDIFQRQLTASGVCQERLFDKPLVTNTDQFVDAVVDEAKRLSVSVAVDTKPPPTSRKTLRRH